MDDQSPSTDRHRHKSTLRQWLLYLLLRIVICWMQSIRIESCQCLAHWFALLCYDILGIRRTIIDDNLRHAFPESSLDQRRSLAVGMWEHIFLLVCELVHVPRKIHDSNWRQYVKMTKQDSRTYVSHLLNERPLVIVSGHFGNFEVGGVIAGLLGFPSFTVARPLDNPFLDRFINRFRETTGQYILPKRGSARQIDAILQAGGTFVLLADQAAGPVGCWVSFFGRPASCHKSVALFSLVNRAPMLIAYSKRLGRPLHFQIGTSAVFDPLTDEIEGVRQLTQWYCEQLEGIIRSAPAQYWWLHRRWKDKPSWKEARKMRRDKQNAGPPASHRRLTTTAAVPKSTEEH